MPELLLPFDPASVGAARRWVGSWLGGWSEEGRSAATLVASELVANVVLHAQTECRVDLSLDGERCRLAVADRDRRAPIVKHYAGDAPTGRGLRLVGRLSENWGVAPRPDGKEVWAVLCDRPWAAKDPTLDEIPLLDGGAPSPGPVLDRPIEIRLQGVSLSLLLEAQEHNDELRREFAFLAGSRHLSVRLDALAREVGGHFGPVADGIRTEVDRAAAGGRATVDLRVQLSPAGWRALQSMSELLDQADEYCERAELLTLASSAALRSFRRWYTGEIRRQLHGGMPTRWPGSP